MKIWSSAWKTKQPLSIVKIITHPVIATKKTIVKNIWPNPAYLDIHVNSLYLVERKK